MKKVKSDLKSEVTKVGDCAMRDHFKTKWAMPAAFHQL
jgi:hypothetical protein